MFHGAWQIEAAELIYYSLGVWSAFMFKAFSTDNDWEIFMKITMKVFKHLPCKKNLFQKPFGEFYLM